MKRCPTCNRTFTDETLSFCLDDGSPLLDASGVGGPPSYNPNIKPPQSMGNAPAPTVAYRPETMPAPQPTPSWQPGPQAAPPARKRRAWPWVVGILGVLGLLFVGFIVLIAVLASMGANANNANNSRVNINSQNNRSTNRSGYNANNSNTNSQTIANTNTTDDDPKSYVKSDVQITSLNMAREGDKGEPGESTDSFSPSDRTVYCVVHLNKLKAGTKVKFSWYAVNAGGMQNKLIKELDYNTAAFENIVNAHLTLPQDWPTGDYRVDVSVNDGPPRSLEYSVE